MSTTPGMQQNAAVIVSLVANLYGTPGLAPQIDEIEISLLHYARQNTTKVHNEARLDPRMVEAVTGNLAASFCVGLMAADRLHDAGWREVNGASERDKQDIE